MNRELTDSLLQRVQCLCAEGDFLADEGNYPDALDRFSQALELLPQPPYEWEAATWIYAALGDAHFLAGNYDMAKTALTEVMLCPNSLDNPFIWLRRGEVYFELGDRRQAQDCLASAFMLGGPKIFEGENPKYAAFIFQKLKSLANPP